MSTPEEANLPPPEEPKSKVCTNCGAEKPIEAFSKNQFGKNNRILRRPVCRECYSKKIKINPKEKKLTKLNIHAQKLGKSSYVRYVTAKK